MSEPKALGELEKLKNAYRNLIAANYEHRAASCQTCPTRGACCLDEHFVNVHITRLEAVAIAKTLASLNEEKQREIYNRAEKAVEKYDLNSDGDTFQKTFACPLFEKETGCLVHASGKPAPCISHACYENESDLPPDDLQEEIEFNIERLNRKTYGGASVLSPLPVWLGALNPFDSKS